ncbi:MAG: flagellar biosynthetic protein FliR [Spirochaetaceae bacterium]|nr:flagellar biosynthetic protein FliR [Spirochaetaceae bacterium]
MIQSLLNNAPLFLLIAVRIFALIMTMPLLSSRAISRVVKIALSGYVTFLVFPSAFLQDYMQFNSILSVLNLNYVLLLVGEAMIGVILGFYISIIFSAFSTAGQFFTYQMGFGASEVYDSLAQIENPLMGQFLNLVATVVFLQINGFQEIFIGGILRSVETLNVFMLLEERAYFLKFIVTSLTELFLDGMIIAFPIIGTLFLVSVTTGILSKAAPQMNLLSEGLPITILVAFMLLVFVFPEMIDYFIRVFNFSFGKIEKLFIDVGRQL